MIYCILLQKKKEKFKNLSNKIRKIHTKEIKNLNVLKKF